MIQSVDKIVFVLELKVFFERVELEIKYGNQDFIGLEHSKQ